MGIQGLLKALSPLILDEESGAKSSFNIRQFSNKSLAVDVSSWLFKASYSCAERLVEKSLELSGQPIDAHCENVICRYIVSRCNELLRYASIQKIYLVFDGKRCPLKDVTTRDREERRQKNLEEARKFKALGRKGEADEKYKACLKIAPWMATSVARAVEKEWGKLSSNGELMPRVISVFSPGEADAQLAKLCMDRICDAVISEDSDILLYSAVTQTTFPIIYKFDRDNGSCDVITMDWLLTHFHRPKQCKDECFRRRYLDIPTDLSNKSTKKASGHANDKRKPTSAITSSLMDMVVREGKQQGYGARMFVQACILSGCDYAPSRLNGIGIVNAFSLVKDFANRDGNDRFLTILRSLPATKVSSAHNSEIRTPDAAVRDYENRLARSEIAFYYHPVFDMSKQTVVSLSQVHTNPIWPCTKRFNFDLSFIGHDQQRYEGKIKIASPKVTTKKTIEDENDQVDACPSPHSNQVIQVRNQTTSQGSDARSIIQNRKREVPIPSTNPFFDFSCISEIGGQDGKRMESVKNTTNIVDDFNVTTISNSPNSDISDDEGCGIIVLEKSAYTPSIFNRVDAFRGKSTSGFTEPSKKRLLSRVSESFDQVSCKKSKPSNLLDLTNSPSRKQKPKDNDTSISSLDTRKKTFSSSSTTKTAKSQFKTLSITSYFNIK